ncbi:LysR family transcriptional regulator [Jannaschia sp. M317]|uniref:LysR family transcriptional regulator n=1 Tax=Jannaschia sp. M317 TaxID=2867011 RepID=UPI0021A73068|nr:LysR family transcriptional regulator [Jannaschia sp. M317]UWQ16462.1 LysR family transcriptional regulator [Jannaschia sp. M317]
MNMHQLSVFREVMKTGSMSQAAENLGRTQPAISLALKGLEESLGMSLFDRDTRNMKPVPEAFYLLAEADSMLIQMSRLRRTMQEMQSGTKGEVQMVVMPGVATVLFPDFLGTFAKTRPDIKLSLHTRSSTQLRELVSSQGVDFGFGDFDEDNSRTQQSQVTKISAKSMLALPAGHPLTDYDAVPINALHNMDLGGMQPEHRFEQRVQTAMMEANTKVNVRFRSQTVLPLLRFVTMGQCCAIVDPLTMTSAKLIGTAGDSVVFRPLRETIRYDYAIFIPKLRPLSVLSRELAAKWEVHLLDILDGIRAEPTRQVIGS